MLAIDIGSNMIVGQYGIGVIDGPDEDKKQDIIPLSGTITFSPSITNIIAGTPGESVGIALAVVKGVLDEEGWLCTPGPDGVTPMYRGVSLFATDGSGMSNKNWTWSVVYRFGVINGATPTIPAHALSVTTNVLGPEDHINLPDFAPVPSSPGIGTPQALALLARAEAAADASATNALEAATVALQVKADADAGVFNGTPGAPGNPGDPGKDGSNVIPTDQAVAGNILDPQTETARALSGTIGASIPKATAAAALNIPTYDGNPSVGHPDVLHIPAGWNGYKYWMGFTPFPDVPRENPSIVASNDGVNWVVPTGLTNPIALYSEALSEYGATGWWSDTDLVLSPDGSTLMLYYRGSPTEGVADLWLATSTNGTAWTKTKLIVGTMGASPAIVVEPNGTYTLFEVLPGGTIARRTSSDGRTWTTRTNGTVPPIDVPYGLWHLDVVKVGDTYHALVNVHAGVATKPFRLLYWTSKNGLYWSGSSEFAVPITGGRVDRWGHYRSTLQPAASGHSGLFDLWLTSMDDSGVSHGGGVWRISLIRDFNFKDGETWNFPELAQRISATEPDTVTVMSPEILPALGTPPRSQVPAGFGGTPAIGLRGDTAKDGITALFPPLPSTWSHFTVDALIVHDDPTGGDVTLTSRTTHNAPDKALGLGIFRYAGGQSVATGTPVGNQKVPRWVNVAAHGTIEPPFRVLQGATTAVGIERAYSHATDTLNGTVWVLAIRLRRVRAV